MNPEFQALVAIAQAYFDAAYDMDADRFAALFHPASSVSAVTRVGDDVTVSVTPIATWLAAVRSMSAPSQLGLARRDEILSIDVVGGLAVVKLMLQVPPRAFTDVLTCAKVESGWRIVQKVTAIASC